MDEITKQQFEKAADFHGHICPGLVMGIRAAQIAVREIGVNTNENEVNAVVETDM